MVLKLSKVSAVLLFLFVTLLSGASRAAEFNPADEDEFRNALQSSETNGEDNIINLPGAILDTEGDPFTFNPTDTGSLLIIGEGPGVTIIDADGSGRGISIDTSNLPDDSESDITVDSLTIRNGNNAFGANLFVLTSSANITIQVCAFENGSSTFGGGVRAFTANGNIAVANNSFTENEASFGGGIDSVITTSGSVTMTGNSFTGNSGMDGGGLFLQNSDGSILINNNNFIENESVDGGGAFISTFGDVETEILENNFENNTAKNQGGGLNVTSNSSGLSTIEDNDFIGNSAGDRGAGAFVFTDDDETVFRDNTFTSNSADVNGGGVSVFLKTQEASLTLNDNTFTDSTALTGFGADISVNDDVELDNVGSSVFLIDNTFTDFFSYCANIPGCVPDVDGDIVLSEETELLESRANAAGGLGAGGACALINSELDGKLIWINVLILFMPAFIVVAIYIRKRTDKTKNHEGKTRLLIVLLLVLGLLGTSEQVSAAIFNVSTAAEFRASLSASETNGEDDTIFLATGVYEAGGTSFSYSPAEDNSLTVVGSGAFVTIIDAGGLSEALSFNTVASLPDTEQPPVTDANADITVRDITVRNGSSSFLGAAQVRTDAADVSFQDCIFTNSAAEFGAGLNIFTDSGNITVSGSEFTDNSATFGGGTSINTRAGLVFFFQNSFSANTATDGAAGRINNANGVVRLESNFIDNNTADNRGGGFRIGIQGGSLIAVNNVFAENSANSGGALNINSASGDLTLTSNTMTENSAVDIGGALSIFVSEDSAETNIYNNIFWLNTTILGNGSDVYINDDVNANAAGSEVNLFNNDIGDFFSLCQDILTCIADVSTGSNINEDPDFVNPAGLDFKLMRRSPAIDAGDDTAPSLPVTDFDGNPRITNGQTDMGAFEFIRSGSSGGGCNLASESNKSGILSTFIFMTIISILLLCKFVMRCVRNRS